MVATFFAILVFINSLYGIIPWWAYAVLALTWMVITVIGSFHIQWNYHLKSLHSNQDISENQVAITFDDGPHPEFTIKVLELLKKYEVQATFFCIGRNVNAHPELLKKIIAHGHTVGNHTYSHSNFFGFFGTQKVISELQRTNALIENLTQKKLRLYRPAFGVTNPNIKRALKETGLQSIGWNTRSFDTTRLSEETILKRITHKISKGDIILLHDSSAKTVAVLEQLLLFLRKKDMQSVTVDRLLDIEAYA